LNKRWPIRRTCPSGPTAARCFKLYALYKQATVGDVDGKRPGFSDMVGRAKWDAWNELKGNAADKVRSNTSILIEELKGLTRPASYFLAALALIDFVLRRLCGRRGRAVSPAQLYRRRRQREFQIAPRKWYRTSP